LSSATDEPAPGSISVCLVCRNEADRLGDALASVSWADEIVVMDLQSTDGSAEIARAAGATVLSRTPHPIVEPLRDEVASHAHGTWVLVLDPDERVRPGLAAALRDAAGRLDVDAVTVPRMNIDFGWQPSNPGQRYEPQLRMYRRSAVSWPTFPNRLPKVPEDRHLRLPPRDELVLEHHRNQSVAEAADRLVRYAPAQAQAMIDEGRVFSAADMGRALRRQAHRHLLLSRCWEDGLPGVLRGVVLVNHHFYVWTAFWQLSGAQRTEEDDRYVRRLGTVLSAVQRSRAVVERLRQLPPRPRAARP
jgi:glycosyltransferase involved in cell wall biosynthesis